MICQALDALEVDRLNGLIITHLDNDHAGGLSKVLRTYADRIDALLINPDRTAEAHMRLVAADVMLFAERYTERLHVAYAKPPSAKLELHWEGSSIRFLWPLYGDWIRRAPTSSNDVSVVLRFQHGDHVFLFGGDLPLACWEVLVRRLGGPLVKADVFKAPHHGAHLYPSPTFDYDALYGAVGAHYVIVCSGSKDSPQLPHLHAARRGARVLCTGLHKQCLLLPEKVRAAAEQVHGARLTGLHVEHAVPCAGNVRVRSDGAHLEVEPAIQSHQRILSAVIAEGGRPQCNDVSQEEITAV